MASVIGITDTSTSNNRSGDREHTIVYLVSVDPSSGEGSYEAASASGLPLAGDGHPGDNEAIADSVEASQESEDGTRFSVTVKYTNIVDDTGPGSKSSGPGSNPTNAQPSLEGWTTERISLPLTKARRLVDLTNADVSQPVTEPNYGDPIFPYAGNHDLDSVLLPESPVKNYAQQPYEEELEYDWDIPVLTFKRNEPSFSPNDMYTLNNSVNSLEFQDAAPGTVRLRVTAEHKWKNDSNYYEVSYRFTYNPFGNLLLIEEKGDMVRDNTSTYTSAFPGSGGPPGVLMKPTEKADGAIQGSKEIDTYVYIDLFGQQLPTDESKEPIRSAWCYLTPYDYNTLGL